MEITIPGLEANADISAKQFEAVKLTGTTSDFRVSAIAATTDKPIGILMNEPNAAGEGATVAGPGSVTKARYGGAVNVGDSLSVDADGELVAVVEGTDTTRYIIAIALEDGADQEVHYVLVVSPHRAS